VKIDTREASWVMLVPASRVWIATEGREVWIAAHGDDYDFDAIATIEGGGRYCALVATAKLTDFDVPYARQLAPLFDAPIYVLWTRLYLDDAERPRAAWVTRFMASKDEMVNDDPYALARSLGCPLPDDPSVELAPAPAERARSLFVVEGADRDAVARALGYEPTNMGSQLHLEPIDGGVLVHTDARQTAGLESDVSEALPDATVYGIAAWTAEEFSVRVLKGGTTVGQLAQGALVRARYAKLDSIKGAATLRAILAALHVPADLLL
jgi:hypothetical protein